MPTVVKSLYLTVFAGIALTLTDVSLFIESFSASPKLFFSLSAIEANKSATFLRLKNEKGPEAMAYATIMRKELKKEIIECAESFTLMQQEMFKLKDVEAKAKKIAKKKQRKRDFLKRILTFKKKKTKTSELEDEMVEAQRTKMRGMFHYKNEI